MSISWHQVLTYNRHTNIRIILEEECYGSLSPMCSLIVGLYLRVESELCQSRIGWNLFADNGPTSSIHNMSVILEEVFHKSLSICLVEWTYALKTNCAKNCRLQTMNQIYICQWFWKKYFMDDCRLCLAWRNLLLKTNCVILLAVA